MLDLDKALIIQDQKAKTILLNIWVFLLSL